MGVTSPGANQAPTLARRLLDLPKFSFSVLSSVEIHGQIYILDITPFASGKLLLPCFVLISARTGAEENSN